MATREIVTLKDGSTRYKYKIRRRQPDGRYLTRVKQFRTDKAGQRWARALEARIDDGKHVDPHQIEQRTVGDLIARCRLELLPSYNARERQTRATKLAWWEAQIGTLRLQTLRRAHLLECLAKLERGETPSGRPSGPANRRRYAATLSHLFSTAQRWEWIDSNPASRLARPGVDREPPGRVRFLSDPERERLIAACRQSKDWRIAPLVELAILTGCRQGELLDLRWGDIDWHRRQFALVGDDGERRTKNRQGRSVALTEGALKILRGLHKDRRSLTSDRVFDNGTGSKRFPRAAFDRAVKEAEIEDLRLHDLRHTFASYLLMRGASLAELAEALGHKTLAMVKRYSHLSRSHARTIVDRMEKRLSEGGFG